MNRARKAGPRTVCVNRPGIAGGYEALLNEDRSELILFLKALRTPNAPTKDVVNPHSP